MTNRTVQIWGQGYSVPPAEGLSLTPCTIAATLNGVEVFSGAIPTVESSDVLRLPTDQQVLFTFEIPMTMSGPQAMVFQVTGADVYLEQTLVNYCAINNWSTPTSSGPDGYFSPIQGDCRSNVVCTGATYVSSAPPDLRPAGTSGDWGWEIEVADGATATFSYTFTIDAGVE
jgi:hypothetical protein